MRFLICFLAFVGFASAQQVEIGPAAAAVAGVPPGQKGTAASEAQALKYIDAMVAKRSSDALALINPTINAKLTAERQLAIWAERTEGFGALKSRKVVRSYRRAREEVMVRAEFERRSVIAHFTFTRPPEIDTYFLLPIQSGSEISDANVAPFRTLLGGLGAVYSSYGAASTSMFELAGPREVRQKVNQVSESGTSNYVATWSLDATQPIVRVTYSVDSPPTSFAVERVSNMAYKLKDMATGRVNRWTFFAGGVAVTNEQGKSAGGYRSDQEGIAQYRQTLARVQQNAQIMAQNKIWEAQGDQNEQFAMEIDAQNRANAATMMQRELSTYAARESQIRNDADAMLARVAADQAHARQAAAAAAAAAQAQRDAAARQHSAGAVASAPSGAASSALRTPSKLRANPVVTSGASGTGSLTVATIEQPASIPPEKKPASGAGVPGFIGCTVLKPGSFDSHNGAWFFSEIVSTTIVYGKVYDDPSASFLSKVRATYGITGGVASCYKKESRAELAAFLDEVGRRGYGKHKRVQTGIAP